MVKRLFNYSGLALIAIFWILVIGLRIDDPVAQEIKDFLAEVPQPTNHRAFEYGYGFDAPLGEDPAKVGAKWLEEYRQTISPPAKVGAIAGALEKHCLTNYMQCFVDTFFI